jgi:serine/threonine protein phosphatase PrpC
MSVSGAHGLTVEIFALLQTEAFLRTDEMLYDLVVRKRAQEDSGSTALAALVAGGDLIVANAGDCRAILCRRGRLIELSRDHKASSIHESTRIRAAGASTGCSLHAMEFHYTACASC